MLAIKEASPAYKGGRGQRRVCSNITVKNADLKGYSFLNPGLRTRTRDKSKLVLLAILAVLYNMHLSLTHISFVLVYFKKKKTPEAFPLK